MKVSSHKPSLKMGDLIRVHLPHMGQVDGADLGVTAIVAGQRACRAYGDPSDAWIKVLIEGEIKNIHVDYIREIYNEEG